MAENEREEAELREQFIAEGRAVPQKRATAAWDSNVITPGTPYLLFNLTKIVNCQIKFESG